MKAVVLAAGLGTRLRPFTCVTPKPLMPVWGVPMLERIVETLREMGVDDFVVNCHHLHGQVEEWCRANGCRASYEPEILGTGGVLNPLREWIGNDEFFLVNGDIIVEGPIAELLGKQSAPSTVGTCLVAESGPRTIEVEPESGFVTNWKSDDQGWNGTFTYCGFARLKPEILKYVKPDGFSSIVSAYERAMADGLFVKAVGSLDLMWTDAGTIDSYVEVNSAGDDNAFADFPQLKAADVGGRISYIGARGSNRVFFGAEKGVAIVYDDEARPENARYAGHARWLAERGIPVPAVVNDVPSAKTLVLEDVGKEEKMSSAQYVRVAKALARFNALDASGLDLEPPMDSAMWKWERGLFEEHCLGTRYRMAMPDDVRRELEGVADALDREPRALVHRDFQSSNVLWSGERFSFIDFQGMRIGPAAYDLASLLYDPYVELAKGERDALAAVYAEASGRGDIADVLPIAAVERLVQCLGAYGRLLSVGQKKFAAYFAPALANLRDAADLAGLGATAALARELVGEAHR